MGQLQFSIAGSLARERSQRDDPARAAKALIITAIAALFLLPSTPVQNVALSVSPTDVDFGTMAAGGTQEQVISVSATGIGPAGAIAITLTGDGFALIGSDCRELAKDESCSARVRFSPSAASTSYGGRIDVRSENAGSVTATLRGASGDRGSRVVGSTVISASPSAFDFGAVAAGEMREHQIKISAQGDAPAGRIKTTLTGNAFALDDAGCRKELTENDSCTVTVRFEPSEAAESYKGQLSIRSARAGTVNVALRGARAKPVGPVKLGIMPKPGQFSPQPVGTTSGEYQLTVTNRSSRKIVLEYGDESRSGPFRITGLCSGTTLEPQQSCAESARFAPGTTGDLSGSRDILVDGIVVDSYQLSGRGTAAELSVPDTVVFEGAATSRAVSIRNTGSADLIITQTAIRASQNSSFQRPPADCISRHIPPGATCDVTVTIRRGPRQAVQEGSLVIHGNAAGSPHQVSLRAEIYASDLATDRNRIDFGRRTETPIAIRIVNRGNAATGRMSFHFSERAFTLAANNCGAGIEPGASCDIAARFSPPQAGDMTGYLSVSADNGGLVQIELHGVGPAPEPVIR